MAGKKTSRKQPEQASTAPVVADDSRIAKVQDALAAFPSLPEGYLTEKGAYFDREVAERSLKDGEQLIIVHRPTKK